LNDKQIIENRQLYGNNQREEFKETSIIEFLLDPFEDPMLLILVGAAVISLILGLLREYLTTGELCIEAAYEGLAILLAVIVVDLVTAYNNYKKEQEFKKLQECYNTTHKYIVIRNSKENEIDSEDIVVGDIIKLNYGSQIPVDCVLIKFDGQSLRVDESSITGESDIITKCTLSDVRRNSSGDL